MASRRTNLLKLIWNEIESQRAIEPAWQLPEKDWDILNKVTTFSEFGKFVQAMLDVVIGKRDEDKIVGVAPSKEGAADGYWGYKIEGVHEAIYKNAKHLQFNNRPEEEWIDVLKNETK